MEEKHDELEAVNSANAEAVTPKPTGAEGAGQNPKRETDNDNLQSEPQKTEPPSKKTENPAVIAEKERPVEYTNGKTEQPAEAQTAPSAGFCPKCGTPLKEGMPFCGNCGTKIADAGNVADRAKNKGTKKTDMLHNILGAHSADRGDIKPHHRKD